MISQEIKCCKCELTIVGTIGLQEGEQYKGHKYYGIICEPCIGDETRYISLEDLKAKRNLEINARTKQIIYQGFTHNSKIFSNSDIAQSNYNKIMAGLASGIILQADFPFLLSCMDETLYLLPEVEVNPFYRAHLESIATAKFSGSVLKNQINQCSTYAEVMAIIDTR